MRIAIVAPEVLPVPPIRGGAVETAIEETSACLAGHDVHIFGIADPALPRRQRRGHRTYYRYRWNVIDRGLLSSWKLPFKQRGSLLYYWPYRRWVAGYLRRLLPDIVWVHSRMPFVPALRRAAPSAKLVLSIHNDSNLDGDAVWTDQVIRDVDLLTGCSQSIVDQILARRPGCAGKARVLYNGVNLEAFRPRWEEPDKRRALRRRQELGDGPVVLFAGRLVEQKGAHVLIEALGQVLAAQPSATVLIAGGHAFADQPTTAYITQLREQARPLGSRVRFVGFVPPERMSDWYLMSDVVVFPSLWKEPFGLVVVEAMATGLPVISFNQGGPAEIIEHGRNGLLVEPAHGAEGLARALECVIAHPPLAESLGRRARETAEDRFSWEAVAREFLRLCEQAVPQPTWPMGGPGATPLARAGVAAPPRAPQRPSQGSRRVAAGWRGSVAACGGGDRGARGSVFPLARPHREGLGGHHARSRKQRAARARPRPASPPGHPLHSIASSVVSSSPSQQRAANGTVADRPHTSHLTPDISHSAPHTSHLAPHPAESRPVVLIAESGSGYGGTAKYLADLVGLLDQRRYDVRVVAAHDGPLMSRVRQAGAPVELHRAWRFPWSEAAPGAMEDRARGAWGYLKFMIEGAAQLCVMVPQIYRWLARRRVGLVHLNNEILSHLPLLVASRLAGCRVLCHLHGWRRLTVTERWAVRLVDELVCVTEAGARFHSQQLRGRSVLAIPNGLMLNGELEGLARKRERQRQRFGLAPERVAVSMVGRLVPWKGHEVFLRALARASAGDPRLIGLIVGHDPSPQQAHAKRLEALARELGIEARVRFAPWQEDVWAVYAASDLVVHASVEPEPFGFVILEAMAAGVPVIATRGGGVEELVVDGASGRLVPPADTEELARAIEELARDPGQASVMGRRAQERARTAFSLERNVEQISRVYERMLTR